jgi:hypothetical protein
MQSDLRIILIFVAVVALAAPAAAVDVYVSNPDEGAIYSTATGFAAPLYAEPGVRFENMVVDPTGRLIACAPDAGRIIRLGPLQEVPTGSVQKPQCGWIAANGDLFVTDEAAGTGVYRLAYDSETDSFAAPVEVVAGADFGAAFSGGGVTQAASGDLLVADRTIGQVWVLEIDLYSGEFPPASDPSVLISGLDEPVGVARAADGTIWVATATGLKTFDRFGTPTANPCPALGKKERPYFLDFDAYGNLYVASTSNNSGTLWKLERGATSCTTTPLFTFLKKNGYAPSAEGTAVSLATVAVNGNPVTDPDYLLDPDVQLFSFGDSAWEFLPNNGCMVDITYREASPADAAFWIPTDVSAAPVVAQGDNGRVRIYDIQPANGLCLSGDPNLYRHAISAYFGYVPNPRVVRCPDTAVTGDDCEVTDLSTYYPFNGLLPEDDRVGVRTRDFSEYFVIDVDLNAGDSGDGYFCGFEPPVRNPEGFDYFDPDLLDDPLFRAALPEFSTTENVPFKFRVAAIQSDGSWSCDSGPFIDNAIILFSIARLRTPDPGSTALEPFQPVPVISAGGSSAEDPAIFSGPASPSQYYHYNAKFTGYLAGYYQIVLVPLTDNFAAEVRYFEVVP